MKNVQQQRGCLFCQHINPTLPVIYSCQGNGGTVRSDQECELK